MNRVFLLAALGLMAAPAAAETDAERAKRCAAQAAIVTQAVDLHGEGAKARKAHRSILRSDAVKDGPYAEHVELLVDWVYGLPEAQIGAKTSAAFEIACNAFKN